MTAGLKPYPGVKDTGIPTLGEIPSHWSVLKLRSLLHPVTERNRPDLPLLSVVREKGVILRDISSKDTNHNFIPDDLTNYKVVLKGQFAMNKMKAWQGSYGVSNYNGIVSPAYFVFGLGSIDGGYFHTAIRSRSYVPSFTQASDGVRVGQWDLSQPRMREIAFVVPTGPEQTDIARFLDHMDRRIQKYIRAKEKLIELLEEYKQALIHQAVTGQVDVRTGRHYPGYKQSGLTWLGTVPTHWKVLPIGRFSDVGNGSTPSRSNSSYWSEGKHPWLNSSSVNQTIIDKADQFVSGIALRECHLPMVKAGSVLVGITGQGRTRGMVAILGIDATINQHLAYIEPNNAWVSPRYLQLFLTSAYAELRAISSASGSTRAALTCEDVKRFRMAIPPVNEQEHILRVLGKRLLRIDCCIDLSRREIALLREFQTRLIADIVTGKLDVREAAAELHDTNVVAWEHGVDTMLVESNSHRAEHSIAEEANA